MYNNTAERMSRFWVLVFSKKRHCTLTPLLTETKVRTHGLWFDQCIVKKSSSLSFGARQLRSFELYSIRLYSKPYHFDCDIYLTRVF